MCKFENVQIQCLPFTLVQRTKSPHKKLKKNKIYIFYGHEMVKIVFDLNKGKIKSKFSSLNF